MLSYTIHDLADNEKPRERLTNLGAGSLSDSELLAIILGSGGKNEPVLSLSRRLLLQFEGYQGLNSATLEQLMQVKNIGKAKAVSIKALCEVALRISLKKKNVVNLVKDPKDIFKLTKKVFYGKKKEELYLISLDTRNNVIAKDLVSIGTVNETVVHPREVFRQALLRNAVSIILVHNHPSQNVSPSSDDVLLTEKIAKAGILLGIALVDHVVVSDSEYCSLKALGLFTIRKFKRREVRK